MKRQYIDVRKDLDFAAGSNAAVLIVLSKLHEYEDIQSWMQKIKEKGILLVYVCAKQDPNDFRLPDDGLSPNLYPDSRIIVLEIERYDDLIVSMESLYPDINELVIFYDNRKIRNRIVKIGG
jgi:hypothetical protein